MAGRKKTRLTGRVELRLPPALPRAIEVAAERRFISVSEYVRLSIVSQLNSDGVDILAAATAA